MKRCSPQRRVQWGKAGAGACAGGARAGRRTSVAHGDYSARVLVHRRVACTASEFNRFNLFPYRQVEARRARRRVLIELVLAAAVGGGGAFTSERIDRSRAAASASRQAREVNALQVQFARIKPRAALADRLDVLRERNDRRGTWTGGMNTRRKRIAGLLESIGRVTPDHPGVALRVMEIDAEGLMLDGAAADVQTFAQWLAALRARGALAAPVVDILEREGAQLRFSVRAETNRERDGVPQS
jgi:Tfp pilus assembly protein PilN